jgi:aryl-alcohol dehydrogenase-like predicted oxidoreductase
MFMQRRGSERTLERAQPIADALREIGHPLPQVAIKWTLAHPAVTSPIIGVRTMEQLDTLLNGWDDWTLSPEEKAHLDAVSAPPPLN